MSNSLSKKSHYRWLGLLSYVITCLFYFYDPVLQVYPSVMTQEFMRDFHVQAVALGFMTSVYFIPYVIMQIPCGLLSDKLGVRFLMTVACIITGVGCILFSWAPNYLIVLVARIIMGFAASASTVCMVMMANHWFGGRYFAVFVGVGQVFGNIGSIFGDIPVSLSISHLGWRKTVGLLAILGFFLALIGSLFVRNNRSYQIASNKVSIWQQLQQVIKNRQTLWISIYVLCLWTAFASFAGLWGVPYLTQLYHISTTKAGSTISLMWAASAIGSVLIGWISSRINRRKSLLMLSALIGLISFLMIAYIPHIPFLLMVVLLFVAGLSSSGQALSFAVIRDINHPNIMGAATGLNNMMVMIGTIVIDPLIGYLLVHLGWHGKYVDGAPYYSASDYRYAFMSIPILLLIAILAIGKLKETHCQNSFMQNTSTDKAM